ncbi:MAG TPA: response regulator [Streptosporangiaceae bacterium]|nr:response regulator [Streptosporangiaceae bacterium]
MAAERTQAQAIPEQQAGATAADSDQAWPARERWFQHGFEHMPCGMVVMSLAPGRPNLYLAANDSFCQLSGYSWAELAGREFLSDLHPDEQAGLDAAFQQVISGDSPSIHATSRIICKDGETVFVRLTIATIQPAAGERYLTAFVEDVTAAEQGAAEVSQLRRELARSRRMKSLGHLLDGVAADFNNLLMVIGSYASLVHEEVSMAEAADGATRWRPVRSDIEQIQDAAERAKMLIKHLLAFARRESALAEDVDLGQVVSDAGLLLGELLGEQIPLIVQAAPRDTWPVRAAPAILELMIADIAANARDAMPSGGQVTVGIENVDTSGSDGIAHLGISHCDASELAVLLPGRYVLLRITDTGIGMDPAIAERAFEPFFTTKDQNESAGLGLSAVHGVAAQAGGRAWLESGPGHGTTVTVALPAAPGSGYDTASTGTARAVSAPGAGSVLVIDDNPQIREVVHRVLTSAGYRVTTAASGLDALDLLDNPDIAADLVLTDVVMPGITGNAFAAQLRARRPGMKILFMSGYERPHDASETWPGEGLQVIGKPFSRAALLATVSRLLGTSPAEAGPP